jgi:hypothetical protein
MSKLKIRDVDVSDAWAPICPHCEKPVRELLRIQKGVFLQTAVFACPHCSKILSVGYNQIT